MQRRRWLPLSLGALGVFALIAVIAPSACSDNSGVGQTVKSGVTSDPSTASKPPISTGGTSGGSDDAVKGPASLYSPARTELPGVFSVNVPETFTDNISTFASSYLFTNNQQGAQLAAQWGIIDGFKAAYDPDGLEAGLLSGRYYVSVETYLFDKSSGASDAYDFIQNVYSSRAGSEKQDAKPLGIKSAGYKIIQGTVGTSDQPKAYYSFMFKRGNVVAVVRITGAERSVSVDTARDVAAIIDDRMTGKRPATQPTAIPTPKINIPPTPEPTKAGG
jgi:hypothetical protein